MALLHTMAAADKRAGHRTGARPWRRPWPWPLPAVAVWLGCWLLAAWSGPVACVVCVLAAAAWPGLSRWRRGLMAAGFPLSALATGIAAHWPAWAWLLPLAVLLLAYPVKAWRDAPLFPTPGLALQGLGRALPLPPGARVLDAGCGLGHGLQALAAQWPQARLLGVEWSRPLAWAARWRCRRQGLPAQVRHGDMWAADWRACDVVYVFQRPESMARVWQKACAEMAPGSWLVSLDFAVPGVAPDLRLQPTGQPVWLYRLPPASQPPEAPADKTR